MLHRVRFVPRASPLVARAVLAEQSVVDALLARLRERSDRELAALECVRAPGLLALLGPTEALPWCAGVVYFGNVEHEPRLLLPVLLEPDVPPAWLCAALGLTESCLVLPRATGLTVVPVRHARPLSRAQLASE